jgi:hypothetical protein
MRSPVPIAFLTLVTSLAFGQAADPIPPDAISAMAELRKEPFRAHMAFLADDLLEGRGPGKRGHEIAALYVAEQFEGMGLNPAGNGGTYFQRVPMREIHVDGDQCAMVLTGSGFASSLKWGDDFVMFRDHGGPEGEATLDAPLVFAGFGVQTPDGSYDDYAGLDVKGKIVVLLQGAPHLSSSELAAHLSALGEKMRIASDHGAAGVVMVWTPKDETLYPWNQLARDAGTPTRGWIAPDGQPGESYPRIRILAYVSAADGEKLFQHTPKPWSQILADADASKAQGFPLNLSAHLRFVSHHVSMSSPNVVALITGSDPKLSHEYVVYSAHVDHLGIGTPVSGDAIYNGAVDDASGVAALLVIAKAFGSLPQAPARSILFIGTTGEEDGLLGSDYFAHFPTVPIESIVADINMDGASMLYTFKDIVPLGAADSTLDAIVAGAAAQLDLKVSPDPDPDQHYFVRADQYSFVRQGVPSLFISEGRQAKDPNVDGKKLVDAWVATRYHQPSDDMNQPLSFDAPVEFMQVDFLVGYGIAQAKQRPQWKPGDFFGETFGRK